MANEAESTTVGNYFVANYPPFSFWTPEDREILGQVVRSESPPEVPLGLYVHIPFCRKRCDFCYFKVYTDKNAQDIKRYLDAVLAEFAAYRELPRIGGRRPRFVYFGGGTPSYLSARQLGSLFEGLKAGLAWDEMEEVTFECEPGTLDADKLRVLKDLGVTRLSLGVENFDAHILEINNRAHRSEEIDVAYAAAREAGFPQINIDLIAGMVGETDENWQECIAKVVAMAPDAVTIYQMEIPHNTTVYGQMKDGGMEVAPVADWKTKRRWVDEAFTALEASGYTVGSAYTAVKNPEVGFLYRDGLWNGADMLGLGVASFSHLAGVHAQNHHDLEPYCDTVENGGLPVHRALELSPDEKLIREFILQLKLGRVSAASFQNKFGVDVRVRFRDALEKHEKAGFLRIEGEDVVLSRPGLLKVDLLLHDFFLNAHRGVRYS